MPGGSFDDFGKAEACRERPGESIRNIPTSNACQELCRLCKDCNFFTWDKLGEECSLWNTDKSVALSRKFDSMYFIAGPKVCGNKISLVYRILSYQKYKDKAIEIEKNIKEP